MLCRRSASLTRMTRTSSTIASSILRKFSAWRSSLDEKGMVLIFVTPSTTCATSAPKRVADVVDGGERVLDDVVEQAGRDGDVVEAHLGDQRGHLEGVGDVLLPRAPGLAGVLESRELVGAAQQIRIGVGDRSRARG